MTESWDDEDRTTALGLARYAYEYIAAAILVDEHHAEHRGVDAITPMPAYFLAMHGIELTLKAYLRQHVSVRKLRSREFGHDLRACYRKAKELGLRDVYKMRSDDLRALVLLLDLNTNQGLRYIFTGAKRFPSWSIVKPFAVQLHQAIAPLVGYQIFTISFPERR